MTVRTTPASSGKGGEIRRKSVFARAAGAQEIGLVVVIAIMALSLWLSAGTFTKADRRPLPPGSTATMLSETTFSVTSEGRTSTYSTDDGWSYTEPEAGRVVLVSERTVNRFLNSANLINMLTYASFIAIMAVGMTGVIVMNGIDLSIGSVYGLSAVSGAFVLNKLAGGAGSGGGGEVATALALLVGLGTSVGVGALCGGLSGWGTVGLRVHPFIITLGGMAVYRGIAFMISKGESIGGLPEGYRDAVRATVWGMNYVPLATMVVVGLIGAFVMTKTVWGRRIFAIGGNETAARYAGVPVDFTKVTVFATAGALAGLSGAIVTGYLGAASSETGKGYELDVIAAAVVGGAALSGGRGSAVGAVLGAIVIQMINNGFDLVGPRLGIDQNYRQIVIGLAIVLAVVVDQAKHRFGAGGR